MDRFVVGTGRCGSTLLTTMLAKNPNVMVVSEFFAALDRSRMFSEEPISGAEFADFLNQTEISTDVVLRRGIIPKEILVAAEGRHFLPPMLISMLPMISDDPAALYDKLMAALPDFPKQGFIDQHRALFAWLMNESGRSCWIERSGPSAEYLPALVDAFPDAKYVVLHRDGRETVASMMKHPYFQFVTSMLFDPISEEQLMQTEYGGAPVNGEDPLSQRLSPDFLPIEKYGEYWSNLQVLTFKALATLDSDQILMVTFEDLVTDTECSLRSIAEFFEIDHEGAWLVEAAALVTGVPPSGFSQLPADQQQALADACAVGERLLGRREIKWITPTLDLMRGMAAQQSGTSS